MERDKKECPTHWENVWTHGVEERILEPRVAFSDSSSLTRIGGFASGLVTILAWKCWEVKLAHRD